MRATQPIITKMTTVAVFMDSVSIRITVRGKLWTQGACCLLCALIRDNRQTFVRPLLPAAAEPEEVLVTPALRLAEGVGTPQAAGAIAVKHNRCGFVRAEFLQILALHRRIQQVGRAFDMT